MGGRVENFNGWFQDPLLDRRFRRPGDLRRELSRLQEAVNAACPPTSGWQDTGAAPPGPVPAEAARGFRGAAGATAAVRGPRDPHPAGQWGRGGHGAESDVPGGEEASGLVPAAGGGHRTRASDGVPERPCAEALALQAAERLTDIEPRGHCRFPPTFKETMRWRQKHLGDEMMRCRFAPGRSVRPRRPAPRPLRRRLRRRGLRGPARVARRVGRYLTCPSG